MQPKLGDTITIEQVKAINAANGYYFFTPQTMRFFKSRICPEIFAASEGWYFVTSEQFELGQVCEPRKYTIRILREDGGIDEFPNHADGFQAYATKRAAINAIKKHLRDTVKVKA